MSKELKYFFEGKEIQTKVKIGSNAALVRAGRTNGAGCILVKNKKGNYELWATYNTAVAAYKIVGVTMVNALGEVYNPETKKFEAKQAAAPAVSTESDDWAHERDAWLAAETRKQANATKKVERPKCNGRGKVIE